MDDKTKADLVYCMDFIMHHMNDEEHISPWLEDGCPDGLYQQSAAPESVEYVTLGLTDDEFEEYLSLFTRTLAREVMPKLPPLGDFKSERGALA